MIHKVVYNKCFGSFGLSDKAVELYRKYANDYTSDDSAIRYNITRHDPILVRVVEELGKEADDGLSHLAIKEVDGDKYYINDYDGFESVYTPDNINWIYF